ncbi:MAG: hypothetical protein QOI11_3888 [Candidatus Eremiobacteraeota bacterium]|nr:hypothetical protein [Candidatus Eremiobacteraeota bacterium]
MTGELAESRPFSGFAALRRRAEQRVALSMAHVRQAIDGPPLSAATLAFAVGNPLIRNLTERAHAKLVTFGALDEDERTAAAELVANLAEHGRTGTLAEDLSLPDGGRIAVGDGSTHLIRYWEPSVQSGPLVARFAAMVNARGGAGYLAPFTREQRATFSTALAILAGTIGPVAGSLLAHVDVVCRIVPASEAGVTIVSTSFRDISGMVFLSDTVLADPLLAAEHILHEACHQRYSELARDTSLLCEEYEEAAGAKIAVPWHRPGGPETLWGIDKALTAAHVYLHLAYFYGMLDDTRALRTTAEDGLIRRRLFSKLERTRYLLCALDATGRPQLGYAGNAFLDWMRELCASIAVEDDSGAGLTRLVFERCIDGDDEFFRAAEAFSRAGFSADAQRYEAFMAWLDELEPATSRRFQKCLAEDTNLTPLDGGTPHAPLARYCAARRRRTHIMLGLLSLAPGELARRTDARAALTFARTESINLDNFMSARFRDRLVRERALRAAAAG